MTPSASTPPSPANASPTQRVRVFIADDHAIVRDGLRRLIEDTPDLHYEGACDDGNEVLRRLATAPWDVLVLDLSLPSRGGVEVLRRVRAERADLPVVILSAYPEEQYASRLLRAGANAYVAKGQPTSELLTAIRSVVNGGQYIPARQSLGDAPALPPGVDAQPHESLSAREHQVFMLLAQGKSPSEIATDLNVSASTVSTHIAKVREKLRVATVGEIVQYAFRAGLVS